jgi:hypothetical protein
MIKDYLNQRATLLKFQQYNEYGEPVFYATVFYQPGQPVPAECSLDMPVRWEGKRHMVRNLQGEEVVSEARVFSLVEPTLQDRFRYQGRDWLILAVSAQVGLDGNVAYYEVAV